MSQFWFSGEHFVDPVASKTLVQKVLGFLGTVQAPFITGFPLYFSNRDKNAFLPLEVVSGLWPASSGQGSDRRGL